MIYWSLTQNRHLLLSSKIFIYSDCKPIAQAFQLASTNAKVNGWILKLQEFDYKIFHIAGKLNIVTDSLSRVPRELLVRMEQEEQRALMQYHKDEMAPKEKKAANGTVRILDRHEDNLAAFMVSRNGFGCLQMQNWVYWCEALFCFLVQGSFHPDLTKGERGRIQTMAAQFRLEEIEKDDGRRTVRMLYQHQHEHYVPVPRNQKGIIQVMKHFHDQPCAGHYAAEMTFWKVYRAYYWPTIRIDIWNYVRSCDNCQRAQDLAEYPVEPLCPIICLEPFEIVHVDYVGPYTAAGNAQKRFCLFAIDAFMGWLEILPSTTATGNTTVAALEGYCKQFSFPQILHSDQGPHFYNQQCLEWAEKMGIRWVFGSPGQAKGQGKVERAIRSVKTSIRRMAEEKPTAWITLVPDAQLAFNTCHPYSENGHSPSILLLGFTPCNKVLNLVEPGKANRILTDPEGDKGMVKRLQEIRRARLDAVRQEAVNMQIDQWAKRIASHERGLRRHHYVIGDLVLYQNYQLKTQHGNQWTYRWKGPVEIVHIKAKAKLHMRHRETNELMKGWHTDKVRPYILREGSVTPDNLADSETF